MTTPESANTLDDLVALVRNHLDAAIVLITRITKDRQYMLAHAGRALPQEFAGETTLDYSICQHSVAMNFPLVIDDALSHPLMHGNLAVSELGIAAYIGAPVHVQSGKAMGTICALEFHQRRWTEEEVRFITDAARRADSLLVKLV